MAFILYGIIAFIILFTLWMFIATASIGTKYLKTTQYFLSSLPYSDEANAKIKLILDKYDNGLLTAILDKTLKVIRFHDVSTGEFNSEIWIGGKYAAYGMLYAYGVDHNKKWKTCKPSLKSFNRIIALENKLLSELPETSKSDNSSTNEKSENTVILK